MTVGELRSVIAGLSDDTPIRPQWLPGSEPGDHEPGVSLVSFDVGDGELLARVELFYLDEIVDGPEEHWTPVYRKPESFGEEPHDE